MHGVHPPRQMQEVKQQQSAKGIRAMPNVKGKKYPYTAKGMAAAKKAAAPVKKKPAKKK